MVEANRYHYRKWCFDFSLTTYPKGTPLPGIEVQFECPGLTVGGYIYG